MSLPDLDLSNSTRLLMFAYHYPPENVVGSARPNRFAKYLCEFGVQSHIFTAADLSVRPDLSAETVLDPFLLRRPLSLYWQLERALRRVFLPGAVGVGWALKAYQAAIKFLATNGGQPYQRQFIYATYPPVGTCLAAYMLCKKTGLPMILDLRDPINNPSDCDSRLLTRRLYKMLESILVAAADSVVANTDIARDILQQSYPGSVDKITLIWNGFDPSRTLTGLSFPARTQKIYSHIGELYAGRVITPLLHSLDRLISAQKVSPQNFVIQLIGPVSPACLPGPAFMNAAQDWLKVTAKQLPQREAQLMMRESDGLLLIQPHSILQVPGKLFEYIQVGRPILAFIPKQSPIERILRNSNMRCVIVHSDGSDSAIDEAVMEFLGFDNHVVRPSAWFQEHFDARLQAGQLYAVIDRLRMESHIEDLSSGSGRSSK